jgi:uncharacterized protein with HEPN domain
MRKDKVYLTHILDAISDIEKFMQGVSEEEFFGNKEKQYAVLRALEIIGEATKNLSGELKAKSCDVDWKNIAGMRDKLIHAYFGVNLPLVWETVKKDLPQLKEQARKILENLTVTKG